jgi:hypothetical protein
LRQNRFNRPYYFGSPVIGRDDDRKLRSGNDHIAFQVLPWRNAV